MRPGLLWGLILLDREVDIMDQVTLARNPSGLEQISSSEVSALAQMLAERMPPSSPVVVDASEGEGRTLEEVVAFLRSGGVWVSWGGYPFFYTPSTPHGSGDNFARFCELAKVPNPNPQANEFAVPPTYVNVNRALWTLTPSPLPPPWRYDPAYPPKLVGTYWVWGAIAVPVGKGWWFYASAQYGPTTAKEYGPWIVRTATGEQPMPTWLWIIGGAVLVGGGVTAAVLLTRRSRRMR